ncbi:RHS repeat-associated core domain-containing protein [Leifsonia sp. 467MF]|uniref:RHS repeat-associated core domain-containing protein n=1 Tax=Leifsonia sp. 467MF TaxID=1798220 RepID=UPI001E41A642|nr:RHS repeat-associated core domain-containing protein [Leifsonia sp. 467MF]
MGALAEHVTANGEATWDLLDRLGSTVAGATGASITQLSSYDDWGSQQFETTGWSAPENFTGETTDPTQGLNHYYARAYDPSAAAWTSQDPWRGTTDEPRSQHRYGYAWNNPTSNLDIDGNLCARVNPKSDALPVGCGATPVQAHTNVADRSKPPVAPQYPRETPKVEKPKAVGPNSQNNIQDRHDVDWKAVVSNVLGIVGFVAGILGYAPGPVGLIAKVVGAIAGAVSAFLACTPTINASCILNIIGAAVAGAGFGLGVAVAVKKALGQLVPILLQAFDGGMSALGNSTDLFNLITGMGCTIEPGRCKH